MSVYSHLCLFFLRQDAELCRNINKYRCLSLRFWITYNLSSEKLKIMWYCFYCENLIHWHSLHVLRKFRWSYSQVWWLWFMNRRRDWRRERGPLSHKVTAYYLVWRRMLCTSFAIQIKSTDVEIFHFCTSQRSNTKITKSII